MKIITYWTEGDYDLGVDQVITYDEEVEMIVDFLQKEKKTIIAIKEFKPTTAEEFIKNYKD